MVGYCTKQGYTEAPLPASRSRASVALFRGATPPRNPLCPPLDPPLRDGLRGGFLALDNGRCPMSITQIEKDSRRKAVNGVISSFQLEGKAITDEFKILLEDYINGKISTDEMLAMVSGEPTTTEYDYEITPRTLGLGGGWNLRLLENGEEVGGGVFPLPEHCDFRDEKALQTLLDSLYEDALAEASAWLASR